MCSAFVKNVFYDREKPCGVASYNEFIDALRKRRDGKRRSALRCLVLHRRKRPLSDDQDENENDFKQKRSHAGSGHTLEDQVDHAPKDDGAPAGVPSVPSASH